MNPRLLMLPVEEINQALPKKGLIYDIGCSTGDFSAVVAQSSPQRTVVGIDSSQSRIKKAQEKYQSLNNLTFHSQDALKFSYQNCDGAILSDFLHHLSYQQQQLLLKTISKKINSNGVLIIKEINKDDLIRHRLSRLWDFILYPKDKIAFRGKTELKESLIKLNFEVIVTPQILWFPGSTNLFVCRKK